MVFKERQLHATLSLDNGWPYYSLHGRNINKNLVCTSFLLNQRVVPLSLQLESHIKSSIRVQTESGFISGGLSNSNKLIVSLILLELRTRPEPDVFRTESANALTLYVHVVAYTCAPWSMLNI